MTNTEADQNKQPTARVRTAEPARIRIPEIAKRLDIGRLAVYDLLAQGVIPGIRLGKRWIVTRHAYLAWEKTAGRSVAA